MQYVVQLVKGFGKQVTHQKPIPCS